METLVPLVDVSTQSSSKSKYNSLLPVYSWLMTNANMQGFKPNAQYHSNLESVIQLMCQYFMS